MDSSLINIRCGKLGDSSYVVIVTLMRNWEFLFFYGTKIGTVDDIIEGGIL